MGPLGPEAPVVKPLKTRTRTSGLKPCPPEEQVQTELRYTGDTLVGGMIASVNRRMIEGDANKFVDQFFAAAAEELKKE
jgi:Carbon monoxide dehydrogenase subunit G (CoxG)